VAVIERRGGDLVRMVAVVRRRMWLIVIPTLLGGLAAVAFGLTQRPVYVATAVVVIQPAPVAFQLESDTGGSTVTGNDPVAAATRVQTEVELLRTQTLPADEQRRFGTARVAAGPIGQSNLVAVRGEGAKPQQAAGIANAFANRYVDNRRRRNDADLTKSREVLQAAIDDLGRQMDALSHRSDVDQARLVPWIGDLVHKQGLLQERLHSLELLAAVDPAGVRVEQPASVPTSASSPHLSRNVILGVLLGLIAGAGLAFVIDEYADERRQAKQSDHADEDAMTSGGFGGQAATRVS
jgi:uncharacterized protein involved in exopolysaccharide biosynthesis